MSRRGRFRKAVSWGTVLVVEDVEEDGEDGLGELDWDELITLAVGPFFIFSLSVVLLLLYYTLYYYTLTLLLLSPTPAATPLPCIVESNFSKVQNLKKYEVALIDSTLLSH